MTKINKKSIRLAIASIKNAAFTDSYKSAIYAQADRIGIDFNTMRDIYRNYFFYHNGTLKKGFYNIGYKLALAGSDYTKSDRTAVLFGHNVPLFSY